MKKFIFYNDHYKNKIHVFPISALKDKTKLCGFAIFDHGRRGFDWSIAEMEKNLNSKITFEEAVKIVGKDNLKLHLSSFLPKKISKWKSCWKNS
jgi:hypothetical protein